MKSKKRGVSGVLNSLGWTRKDNSSTETRADASAESHATAAQEAQPSSPRKESLFAKFQKYMAAAAFAELGEHAVAQEMVDPGRGAKRVLLVIDGNAPALEAFTYALNLSRRTDSGLDILQVIERSGSGDEAIGNEQLLIDTQDVAGLRARLREAGIPHSIVIRQGDTNEAVLNYTREHGVISALVLDSASDGEASGRTRRCSQLVRRISRYLAVPIVTVMPRTADASRS